MFIHSLIFLAKHITQMSYLHTLCAMNHAQFSLGNENNVIKFTVLLI